ncbi:MAG: hypothetical protein JWN24_1777 [Phycisphaerales bacterium]|nr:hypothetical protein [Phycisphaerales bacterium]
MRKYIILTLIVLAVLAYGTQKLYVFATNRSPARMPCGQFIDSHSSAKWLELSGCDVDYIGAIRLESKVLKVDKGTFLPVHPVGVTGPAPLLLQIKSEDMEARLLKSLAQRGSTSAADPSSRGAEAGGETVSGLIRFGMDSDSKVQRALEDEVRSGRLSRDYVIIDDGARPDPADALLGAGLIAGVLIIGFVLFKGRRKPATPPPLPLPVP